MTNSYNESVNNGKEPINLSQIVASFLKAFKKLWWIMVAFMIVFAVLGYMSENTRSHSELFWWSCGVEQQ